MELKNKLLLVVMIMFSLVVGCKKKTIDYGSSSGEVSDNSISGKVFDNSIGMKLVLIPAGEFMMGTPPTEDIREVGHPQHRVKISKSFYMGIYEVTQTQYQAVMGANPSYFKGDDLPVEQVSRNDAIEFCRKLSQKEGRTYRLPTEAEWEYACRAGTTTRFYYGDDLAYSQLGEYGWYSNNSDYNTHPVGQKKPNAFGLYDMLGNVWEWCQDWYDRNYYTNSPAVDPQGPSSGQYCVIRGGNYRFDAFGLQSSFRGNGGTPSERREEVGFRLVLNFQ
jgi:formylglycine-generating enzyme required for sulfatase activity